MDTSKHPSISAQVAIIVPVLKNFKGFTELAASIRSSWPYKLYVIPNWKIDDQSVAKAWNEGIKRAIDDGMRYFIVINDDVVLKEDTIDNMVAEVASRFHPTVVSGWNVRDIHTPMTRDEERDDPDFACFGFDIRVWLEVGEFDEDFAPAYFEDNDYKYRCKLADVELVKLGNIMFDHQGSATQFMDRRNPIVPGPAFNALREQYRLKWGGYPHEETFKEAYNGEI